MWTTTEMCAPEDLKCLKFKIYRTTKKVRNRFLTFFISLASQLLAVVSWSVFYK